MKEYEISNYRLRQISISNNDEFFISAIMSVIRTIDSVQEKEWDFIINADRISNIDHINDDHRACVALTKIKKCSK